MDVFAAPDAGSPKLQECEVGLFVELSVNCTRAPGPGLSGEKSKLATGIPPPEATVRAFITDLAPDPFMTVSKTLKVPATP